MSTDSNPTLRARAKAIREVVRQLGVRKTASMLFAHWSQRIMSAVRKPSA